MSTRGNDRSFPTDQLFEIPAAGAYFNCAFTSPMLRCAVRAGQNAFSNKKTPWRITPEIFFEGPERTRKLFSKLIDADAEGIAIGPSVSYGMAIATAQLRKTAGGELLCAKDEFPSTVYALQKHAAQFDKTIRYIVPEAGESWTSAFCRQLSERTEAVFACPSHWLDGSRCDILRLRTETRRVGAALIVDGTQSIGAVPMSVLSCQPEMVITTPHKWLFGPYGVALMYIGEAWRDGDPIEENWLNRMGSDELCNLTAYEARYRPGARRFDAGQASHFQLLPALNAALTQVEQWGVAAISRYTRGLIDRCCDQLQPLGLIPVPTDQRSPHLVGLKLPSGRADTFADALSSRGYYVSARRDMLRISCHVFNRIADIDGLTAACKQLLSGP